MKVFALLVLSLYIYSIQAKSVKKQDNACMKLCAANFRPVCAHGEKCHHETRNICFMHNYNCKRAEQQKPALTIVRPGGCRHHNKCPPDSSMRDLEWQRE